MAYHVTLTKEMNDLNIEETVGNVTFLAKDLFDTYIVDGLRGLNNLKANVAYEILMNCNIEMKYAINKLLKKPDDQKAVSEFIDQLMDTLLKNPNLYLRIR